ncbi:Fasciclin-like arabinogalactan protein 11 [Platanthera guangdongensis]|uniref:Fasciclin-like arabinogalactan protein 11 n=1 Tax=Platanthera guangdongensis TaxID=2320717 RepID=A0ABR2LFZ2_9ASPA
MKKLLFLFSIILTILLHSTTKTQAQTTAAAAAAPPPAGPPNITAVLEKAGQFSTLIRLMKSTQIADQINNQLNNSNTGITVFAPADNAFSGLPAGTLNSLSDQQKVALIQFHIIPSLITAQQFQTVSNPVRTQAGDTDNGQFPLNVTSAGGQVNITTGVVNTTVSNTIYADSELAVYQVDRVLLPEEIFDPAAAAAAPAAGPASAKSKKKKGAGDGPTTSPSKDSADASSGFRINRVEMGRWVGFLVAGSFITLNLLL